MPAPNKILPFFFNNQDNQNKHTYSMVAIPMRLLRKM